MRLRRRGSRRVLRRRWRRRSCRVLRRATRSQHRRAQFLLIRASGCQVTNQFRQIVLRLRVDDLQVQSRHQFVLLVLLFAQARRDATMQVRFVPSFCAFVRQSLLVLRAQFVRQDMRHNPNQHCDLRACADMPCHDRSRELLLSRDQARGDRASPKSNRHENLPAILRDRRWRRDLNGLLVRRESVHPIR